MQLNIFQLNNFGMYTFLLKRIRKNILLVYSCIHMNELTIPKYTSRWQIGYTFLKQWNVMLILVCKEKNDNIIDILLLKLVFKSSFKPLFWTYKRKVHQTWNAEWYNLLQKMVLNHWFKYDKEGFVLKS